MWCSLFQSNSSQHSVLPAWGCMESETLDRAIHCHFKSHVISLKRSGGNSIRLGVLLHQATVLLFVWENVERTVAENVFFWSLLHIWLIPPDTGHYNNKETMQEVSCWQTEHAMLAFPRISVASLIVTETSNVFF